MCWDLLNTNGILLIIVPNDFNPIQNILRDHLGVSPWWVSPPYHINYFSPDSLKRLVERNGFKTELCETTFPIDWFLLFGDNYIGNDNLGRACHAKRKAFEMAFYRSGNASLLREIAGQLGALNIGREIVIYARKTDC